MNLYLLDAGGAGLFFGLTIVFMIITIVFEAVIMLLFKYNKAGKCFLDAFIVNIASLVAGYIILFTNADLDAFSDSKWLNFLFLYGLTVVLEFGILYLLNRKRSAGKTFLVCLIMNIASYAMLYIFSSGSL